MQGHLNSPLTAQGMAQAESVGRLLARELAGQTPVRIVSSPLGRAMNTAALIAQQLGQNPAHITPDPLLAEVHLGQWQGLTNAQVDRQFPGARQKREADKWRYRIPGGESYAQAFERAVNWLAAVSGESLLVAVAHEMIGRAIRGAYLQLASDEILALTHPHSTIYRLCRGKVTEITG